MKIKRERGKGEGPGEEGGSQKELGKGPGPRKNWEKVQVLWICRAVGVFPSRVIRNKYRIQGLQNDHLVFSNKPD